MIHYHGLRGINSDAVFHLIGGGHAFVSFQEKTLIGSAIELCQSFALDNGAFTAWKAGAEISDWTRYYEWVQDIARNPNFDFAVIPDVIDGSDADNDALLKEWPNPRLGAPVWHMASSLDRLAKLAADYPRVCIGSSGQYSTVGSHQWWARMAAAMDVVCDQDGFPRTKLHGLRMLNPEVFSRLPLASADSTNVVRNLSMDSRWSGTYAPPNRAIRANVLRARIETVAAPTRWTRQFLQEELCDLFS